jgi:hypothetical protein
MSDSSLLLGQDELDVVLALFWSDACRDRFGADPDRYASSPGHGQTGHQTDDQPQ